MEATAAAAETAAQRCRCQNPNGAQALKLEGIKSLSSAQSDLGSGERIDQGSSKPAVVSGAGHGEGRQQIEFDRRHSYPAQVIQVQALPAAGAGNGIGVRGSGRGDVAKVE